MKPEIIKILNDCNIVFDSSDQLNGMEIPRDILLSKKTYENIKPSIDTIKKSGFSSSSLTALQKNAHETQKWPLLNLVRQILRASNFNLFPIRKAIGRNKCGKKLYKRFFKIQKLKDIKEHVVSTV